MSIDISKALFKVFVPFTVEINGKKRSMSKEIIKYMATERFKAINDNALVCIEDEDIYDNLPVTSMKNLTVDPSHAIYTGTFGKIHKGGIDFYAMEADNKWEDVDIGTIRFAYPFINVDKNGKDHIRMIHLVARAILKRKGVFE
jgi:hypothetical protein